VRKIHSKCQGVVGQRKEGCVGELRAQIFLNICKKIEKKNDAKARICRAVKRGLFRGSKVPNIPRHRKNGEKNCVKAMSCQAVKRGLCMGAQGSSIPKLR
jgi:hypothetical protein